MLPWLLCSLPQAFSHLVKVKCSQQLKPRCHLDPRHSCEEIERSWGPPGSLHGILQSVQRYREVVCVCGTVADCRWPRMKEHSFVFQGALAYFRANSSETKPFENTQTPRLPSEAMPVRLRSDL